jgi:glycosyltransferase involved in cell wall biosynthesis
MYTDTACVLHLPNYSQTLRQVPYLHPVAGEPLFLWNLRWLCEHAPARPHLVVNPHSPGFTIIEDSCKAHGISLILVESRGTILAVQEAAQHIQSEELLIVGLGMPVAPDGALQKLLSLFRSSNPDYAWVGGLPEALSPEVYRVGLIRSIAQLPSQLQRSTLRATVQSLLSARAATGAEFPFPLRAQALDAVQTWGLEPSGIPASIEIDRPETAAHFGLVASGKLDSRDRLLALKRLVTDSRKQVYESRVSPSRVRPSGHTPRILFVSNASAYTGAEESLCEMIGAFERGTSDLLGIIALEGLFADRLRGNGVQLKVWNQDFGAASLLNATTLYREFRRLKPDVIHFNGQAGLSALTAARILNIPYVLHARLSDAFAFGELALAAGATVAVSHFVRSELLRLDLDPSRVVVIHDGIDTDRFRPGRIDQRSARRALGLPEEDHVLLMIARFVPYKRHDVLLRAAGTLAHRFPNLHVLLVGEAHASDASFESAKRSAAESGVTSRVTFMPFQTDIRIVEAAADVQVLCSDREPLGTCILESMAMEVPVIITDTGGLREIVEDGDSGFIIKSGDYEALAHRIGCLLTSPDTRRRMGASGRKAVCEKADVRNNGRQFESVLRAVAQRLQPVGQPVSEE